MKEGKKEEEESSKFKSKQVPIPTQLFLDWSVQSRSRPIHGSGASLANNPRRVLLQVLDQIGNIGQVLAQHILLALTRQRIPPLQRIRPLGRRSERVADAAAMNIVLGAGMEWSCGDERAAQLATAPLQEVALLAGPRKGRGLGHEVKVEKLHGLELDVAGGGARLEDGGDGQQAVELLKGAGVLRGLEEGDDEDLEGGGLDGGTVDGLEEIEE